MNKYERMAIAASVVLVIVALLLINFFDFGARGARDSKEIGYIASTNNDTRHKSNGEVFWQNAKTNESVASGDKVFTGKQSSLQVILKNKSVFDISENSLVEFRDYHAEKIPSLALGNLLVSVKGTTRVMIGGQVAEIHGSGDGAQVQLGIDKNKHISFRTVKGESKIDYSRKSFTMTSRSPAAEMGSPLEMAPSSASSASLPATEGPAPLAELPPQPALIEHTLSLYDVYEKDGERVVYRKTQPTRVSQKITLDIAGLTPTDTVYLEHADNAEFNGAEASHITAEKGVYLTQPFVGANYWRYSPDRKRWSAPVKFDLVMAALPNSQPTVESPTAATLIDGRAQVPFSVHAPVATNGFLAEYSSDANFSRSASHVFWFYQDHLTLHFTKTGPYFARFRAVDKNLGLSSWSETRQVVVTTIPLPAAPRWVSLPQDAMAEQSLAIEWTAPKRAHSFEFSVLDATKSPVYTTTTGKTSLSWKAPRGGRYFLKVEAIDTFGRHSPPAPLAALHVESPTPPVLAAKPRGKRLLTSTDLTAAFASDGHSEVPITMRAIASIAPSFYSFQSAAQNVTDKANNSAGVVANFMFWLNDHGFEGILQKNMASSNSTTTSASADFTSFEARYRYRLLGSMTSLRSFQTSAFAGYEISRNSDRNFFVTNYNLFKLGAIFDVPLWNRWLASGHLGYGFSSSARQYEGSFNLDYFFRENWSLGAGYTINLLEFNNPEQFPTFTVFREGYTNGLLNVKYFF